jgi:hypothetical protein
VSSPPRRRLRDVAWFAFIAGGWVVFFAVLLAGRLDDLWRWVRDLPLVVELVLWLLAFPWLLATAVWESSWATWLRVLLVALFTLGWTAVSLPRKRPAARSRPAE